MLEVGRSEIFHIFWITYLCTNLQRERQTVQISFMVDRRWRNFRKNFAGTFPCICIKRFYHSQSSNQPHTAVLKSFPYISEPISVLLGNISSIKEMPCITFTISPMAPWKSFSAIWWSPFLVNKTFLHRLTSKYYVYDVNNGMIWPIEVSISEFKNCYWW